MKQSLPKFMLITLLISIVFMSFKSSVPDVNDNKTGDVVYSILSPDLFNNLHQGRWMLLDGAPLPVSTELYTLLDSNNMKDILNESGGVANRLPDARGVFLRGMNIGREVKKGDPDGDRKVGAFQSDTLKSHNHSYTVPSRGGDGNDTDNDEAYVWLSRQTSDYGGNETRPRNIALYVYIKVGN